MLLLVNFSNEKLFVLHQAKSSSSYPFEVVHCSGGIFVAINSNGLFALYEQNSITIDKADCDPDNFILNDFIHTRFVHEVGIILEIAIDEFLQEFFRLKSCKFNVVDYNCIPYNLQSDSLRLQFELKDNENNCEFICFEFKFVVSNKIGIRQLERKNPKILTNSIIPTYSNRLKIENGKSLTSITHEHLPISLVF